MPDGDRPHSSRLRWSKGRPSHVYSGLAGAFETQPSTQRPSKHNTLNALLGEKNDEMSLVRWLLVLFS
jgi:hypothetical protein